MANREKLEHSAQVRCLLGYIKPRLVEKGVMILT
jgi:hypothetical protein